MRHWAERDLAGMISWAAGRSARTRLYALGHSFGGQAVGLAPNADRLEALVTVGAQSGYWGHWPSPQRYGYAMLWYAGMPILSRLLGYFPSRRLGLGEDLPRGVALQWARWYRRPEYLGDYGGHQSFDALLLAISFSDDRFAPRAAVEALHTQDGSANLVYRHLTPGDAGTDRVGHFGFFREGRVPGLGDEVASWLER
jgi:predicted alpha/beta hydrolase